MHFSYMFPLTVTGKMCVLDCAPSALKMLHNSTEFMPYVIFIAAPGMEQLKQIYAERRATGGSQRNLTVCMPNGIMISLYVFRCGSINVVDCMGFTLTTNFTGECKNIPKGILKMAHMFQQGERFNRGRLSEVCLAIVDI